MLIMQKCFTLCRLILLELSHHTLINEVNPLNTTYAMECCFCFGGNKSHQRLGTLSFEQARLFMNNSTSLITGMYKKISPLVESAVSTVSLNFLI